MPVLACWLWGLRPVITTIQKRRQKAPPQKAASGQPISLMDGKLSFSLPADMTDQSGKLGTRANNMHVYSDPTGQKAVIVIVGDNTDEALPVLANRLLEQQRSRDPQAGRHQ